ncbi:hypothetical protein BJ742DRAFT_356465 [Cladochytrium replicatum]|nr:hypothetical protein BJ742DRAFT_356465 [Cladochytrium replicatum]
MSAFNISTEKTDQNASESDNAGQTPLLGTLHLNGFVEPSTALPESASPALSVSSAASSRRNSGIFGLLFSTPTPSPTPLRHQETALQVVEASDHVELGSIDSPHPNPPSVNFEPPALLDSAPTTPVLELAGSSHGSPGSPAAKSRLPMPISVSTMGPPPASRLKGRTRANSGAPQPSRLRTPSNLRDSLLESIEESMTTFEEAVAKVNSDSQKEKESVEGSAPLTPSSETSTSSATPLVPSSTSTAETQRARSGPVATPPQPWRFPWQTPPQPAKQTDGKIQPDAHIRPSAIPIPAGKTPTMSLVGSAPNTAASSPLTQTRARSSSTASQGFRFPWQSAPQETKEIEAREDTTTQSQTDSRPSSQHEASPANPLAFLFNSFDPKNNENHNREEIASNAGSRPSSRPSSVVSTPEMPVRKSNRPHTPFDFLFDIPVMPSSEKMKQKTLEVKAADAMSTAPSTPTVEHSRDFGDETITSDSQIPSVVVQPAESKLDGTTDVNETRISPSLQPESSKSSDGNDNTAVMARMPSNASNVSMSRQSSMPNMLRRSSSASSFSSPASPFWFNFAKPAGMERSLSAPGSPISVRNSIYYSEGDRSSRICDDDDLVMHDVDADSQGSLGSPRAVDAEVNEQSRADDDRETHTSSPWSNVASFEPLDVNEVISTWRPTALEPIGEEQELSETEEASPTTMGVDEKVLKRNETLFRNGPVAVAPGTLLQNKLANALASRGGGALEAVLPRLKFRTTSRPEPPTPDAEDKVLSAGEVPKRFGEVLVSPVSVQMMHDRAWADGHILKNADETGALSPILEEHDGPMEARIEEESPLPDYGFEDTDNGALAALNQPVCRPDQIDLAAELQALQKSNERLQEQNQRLMYELSIATPLDDGPSDLSYSQNPSPEPTASGAATPMSSASPSPTPSFHRRSFIPLSHRRSLRHLRPASSMSTTSTSSSGTLPEASMHFSGSDDNVESLRAHIAELQNRLAELVGQQGDTPYLLEKDLNLFGSPAIHKHVDVADIALSPIMEVRQLLLTNDVGIHPFYDVQSKEDQAMNNVNAPIQLQSHDVEVQLDICGTFVDAETSTDLPELQDIFVQTTDTNFTSSEAQVKL